MIPPPEQWRYHHIPNKALPIPGARMYQHLSYLDAQKFHHLVWNTIEQLPVYKQSPQETRSTTQGNTPLSTIVLILFYLYILNI